VSVDVPQGCVYGLLGPNGAGKTTLIRIINHITAPDSGSVIFDGNPLTANDIINIGYLPEERGLYKKMKVGEQAIFFAQLKGMSRKEATVRLKEWFERLEIEDWWGKKIEELSKGMAQKVQFIITVLHRPKLLIFDEPFSGFDPINANILKREILRLREEGATVIFSTHNMSSVEELCDHITLINKSENILTGSVAELRRRFAGKNVRVAFNGDIATFKAAIENMAVIVSEDNKNEFDSNRSVVVDLHNGVQRRDFISTVNNAVDLVSFEPMLTSMDNIFIQAVNAASNC
jgi:ABC-2 type transport system ATP-binding protein